MYIFFGIPLHYCLLSFPLVILLLFCFVCITLLMKALQICYEKKHIQCWVAEALTPYFYMRGADGLTYRIVSIREASDIDLDLTKYNKKVNLDKISNKRKNDRNCNNTRWLTLTFWIYYTVMWVCVCLVHIVQLLANVKCKYVDALFQIVGVVAVSSFLNDVNSAWLFKLAVHIKWDCIRMCKYLPMFYLFVCRFRRREIGSMLVETAKSWCHRQGFYSILLAISEHQDSARQLFVKAGYLFSFILCFWKSVLWRFGATTLGTGRVA